MKTPIIIAGFLALVLNALSAKADESWRTTLKRELPLLGHRNWICIVDSAYPLQTSPGVETVVTGEDELTVCKAVFDALAQTRHVQPVVFTDLEMPYVSEADAPGIGAYRKNLGTLLQGRKITVLPHEQIISQLDEAGKTFHILILKTNLTLPYTSVFLRLECGYWNDAAEQRLRRAIH